MRALAIKAIAGAALAGAALAGVASGARAQEAAPDAPHQSWSFAGVFGTFDRGSLQRGFQVYNEVCSNCHSMQLLHYRDLGPDGPGGGIGFSDAEVAAIAAQKQVEDGPNDQGEMFRRPGKPQDQFVSPFPNAQAAKAANGGAAPPDLSVMVKARGKGLEYLWGEGGPDYVYGILNGFRDKPPAGVSLPQGKYYNEYFDSHAISMPPPLADNTVKFQDGTPATLPQEAHDVVTFLTWAAEPYMEERKETGAKTILFLVAMTGVLYGAKRKVWKDLH
jgi:ubiquinol-cytochrome c reductase cytochrome b/c1 subunit